MGGHFRQRGSSWELVAYAGRDPLSGKRKYVSRTFKGPKRDAQAALDRLVVEVEDGHEGWGSNDTSRRSVWVGVTASGRGMERCSAGSGGA